jgi:Domain of unknown function (DUF4169)
MGDIVNLRRARKRQDQRRAEAKAAENRILHGMTKAERRSIEPQRQKAERDLDARKVVPSDER